MKLKKFAALLLILALALTAFVACDTNDSDDDTNGKATVSGTKKDDETKDNALNIVGNWVWNVNAKDLDVDIDYDMELTVTFEFKDDNTYRMSVEKDALKTAFEDLFTDEAFLKDLGVSAEDMQQAIDSGDLDLDELAEGMEAEMTESGEYSFDGKTLKLDGETIKYSYGNGTLTLTDEETEIVLKKQ